MKPRFSKVAIDDEDEIPVMAVEHVDSMRESAIEFNVAEVRKSLASAVRMVMAGDRVVLDSDDSYIENRKIRERMKLKVKDGTYVFDVQCKDGEVDEFTLDSGAEVNVWPQGRREDTKLLTHVCRQRHRDPEFGPQDRAVSRSEGGGRSQHFVGFHPAGEACMGVPGSRNAGGTISNSSSAGFA